MTTEPFLLDRANRSFLAGRGGPSLRPEAARILLLPASGVRLLRSCRAFAGALMLLSGLLQLAALGLLGLGLLVFILALSVFLAGMLVSLSGGSLVVAGGFFPVILGAVGAWLTTGVRRSWPRITAALRLAREGRVLTGRVLGCEVTTPLHHNGWAEEVVGSFRLDVAFATPAGPEVVARVRDFPARPSRRRPPEPGDVVAVLYAGDDNFQVL